MLTKTQKKLIENTLIMAFPDEEKVRKTDLIIWYFISSKHPEKRNENEREFLKRFNQIYLVESKEDEKEQQEEGSKSRKRKNPSASLHSPSLKRHQSDDYHKST